ncbi:MAG: GNAT family N-acetyltransferase [Dehalococcoidales bacterium]|jgi:RimJ/RimL family protein N-acetyltransferase
MKTLSHCDSDAPLAGDKTRLRVKIFADAERDYQWQTDNEITYLDASRPLRITFTQYLAEYLKTLSNPSPMRRFFAIETLDGEHIGNCTFYSIDRERGKAELGIMIGQREYWGKGYGTDAVNTMLGYIFNHTGLKRIRLKTLVSNIRARKCFLKCGFAACGQKNIEGYQFLLMEISHDRWLELAGKSSATNTDVPHSRTIRE